MSFGSPPPFEHIRDEKYRKFLATLREKVAPILANNLLPHFTDHSVDHSDHVTSYVDQLQAGIKNPLSDQELMILYSSCYLHDIGMQFERANETKVISDLNLIPPWGEQGDTERRILLRDHHNLISAEMVQASIDAAAPPIGITLTKEFNGSYVARLCAAHCIPTDTDEYRGLVEVGPDIRMPLLSALLRIADILDESRRRASREIKRTRLLDLESQTHWWRHYYTENVILDPDERSIKVWFDFPPERVAEYTAVVPELQLPWIEAELQHHNGVLLENGCQWHLKLEVQTKLYSDSAAMPEEVLMEMLKQLSRHRRSEDEAQKLATLAQFKEVQPSIRRRMNSLKERQSELEIGAYLNELSQIANDLFELGGRIGAHSLLYSPYVKDLKQLSLDKRLEIGLRLLEWDVDSGNHFEATGLLNILSPECDELLNSDERKWQYTKLKIKALDMSCDYLNAKAAIMDALDWVNDQKKPWLKSLLSQMRLLHGDFDSIEDFAKC